MGREGVRKGGRKEGGKEGRKEGSREGDKDGRGREGRKAIRNGKKGRVSGVCVDLKGDLW